MTAKKIEKLTDKQQEELIEWRKRFLDIGWSTKPSDRPKAEEAICALYKRMNLKPPEFVWCDSPFAATVIIKESTGKSVQLSGTDGSLDAYWVAFYSFCIHIGCEVKQEDKEHLEEWNALVQSTGPCYPYTKICLMTERPVRATYDEREVLHGEGAPALEYKDGSKIYAVHGIRVPEIVVMTPWKMTLADIEKETNADVQTIMQEAWCDVELDSTGRHMNAGGGRWLKETGAQTLDMDVYTAYVDEETGDETQIQRALLVDKRGWKYLMCSDSSTDRVYYIRVAEEAKTCREGHESINGGIPDSKITVSS